MKTAKNQSQSDRVSDFWPMCQKCQDDKKYLNFFTFSSLIYKKVTNFLPEDKKAYFKCIFI